MRSEIITGIGGWSLDRARNEAALAARERGLAVTITTGTGVCAPWPDEVVLVVIIYHDNRDTEIARAEEYADHLRFAFAQESVLVARQQATYKFVEA